MLGDPEAGACGDEGRTSRDIVGARSIAAGADNVDGIGGRLHGRHLLAHDLDGAGDLIDRLAAHPERHEEAPDLRRRGFARHQHVEGRPRLVARQGRAACRLGNEGFEVRHVSAPACWRKFFNRAWPCSEAMLSGWNWTPWMGFVLCCRPMMMPSSVSAVIS